MLCIDTLSAKLEKKMKKSAPLGIDQRTPEGEVYWGSPNGGSQITLAVNQAFADLIHLLLHFALVCSQLLGHGGMLGLSC